METDSPALDVPSHVLDYLREQATLTLATSSATGSPHATTLTYVNDGPVVYVWTRPETGTATNMEQNPIAAFAIDEYTPDWRDTKGIQATAQAQVVLNPDEVSRARELFEEKYPALAGTLGMNVSFFRLTPTQLQFIDNTAAGGKPAGHGGVDFHRDVVYSVFRELPPQDVDTVQANLQTMTYDAGDVIVRQGAPADKFFIIIDGEVEVVREEGGEQHELATLSRGQFFGEMAILRDAPRMATVTAKSPTTVFAMERDAFRGLVGQSIGTTQDFDRVIKQRLEEIRQLGPG
jgi:nitroimidazol reductase NimA-like FMN-containing flavoprotein (pyridoxamine 5'-phosphate oxidase superfamily)/quercetin dioxygenase-like cupin family protein